MSSDTEVADQADTEPMAPEAIVGSPAFKRGFADVKLGRRPRFDDDETYYDGMAFAYEWGRQFAVLAPAELPLVVPDEGTLNPAAVNLFCTLLLRGQICR